MMAQASALRTPAAVRAQAPRPRGLGPVMCVAKPSKAAPKPAAPQQLNSVAAPSELLPKPALPG